MNLVEQVQSMPTVGVALPFNGFIRYREARADSTGVPIILLHGIGSGSGSWVQQLQHLCQHVLAWDAPGYADSNPLPMSQPLAQDYAKLLWLWLDQLGMSRVHLVGHSLGCLMAASAAKMQPDRVAALSLLAPAQGYGDAMPAVQLAKKNERLQVMEQLGMSEMARQRSPRLLSSAAQAEHLALAQHMMSRLNVGGYSQATQMLSSGRLTADLQLFRAQSSASIRIACGVEDVITPPAACQALAQTMTAPFMLLAGAGHLCALQAWREVNAWLDAAHSTISLAPD
ncbi:MAG: alpha/beta fold hydrolase [Brachymonas sp.]|nr:alpha/beta fold hydrolase [Brachymonas sp.]